MEKQLTITHTAAEGTIITGTTQSDGAAPILKARRWRFSRALGAWYIPHSRDRAPKMWLIRATVADLEAEHFSVHSEIDTTSRPAAEVEADRIARQEGRVDALRTKAERTSTEADAAHDHAIELADRVPFGQPILVGHHSERGMRRHYERVDSKMRAAVNAAGEANAAADRLATAERTTDRRYSPLTVARRIKRLEAEQRGIQRAIEGYSNQLGDTFPPAEGAYLERLEASNAEHLDQIAYWTEIRTAQIAEGKATELSRDTVAKGDQVQFDRMWRTVLRVNPKSVTVAGYFGGRMTVPYEELTAHRKAPAEA